MAMPKISAEIKEQAKAALRHPVAWWKGAGLPEETVRPWEYGIQFGSEMLNKFIVGFTRMRDRLYLGLGEGKIPPLYKTVSDAVGITWDALNDPLIGVHMDKKQYAPKILRNIMRFDSTFNPLTVMLLCFNFGLTPVQRLILWTVSGVITDISGTANGVAQAKIWAGITPHSEQRGKMELFRSMGRIVGSLFTGVPVIFQGLRQVLGITDYQIMIFGVVLFTPLTIFARWLPSFAKQRVDFSAKVAAEGAQENEAPEKELSLRERFAIVKHHRWFVMWTIIWFIRMFTPGTDNMFPYRFLVPDVKVGDKILGGEIVFTLKNILFELPSFLLSPFAVQAVKKLGGPVNFIRVDIGVLIFTHLTSYLVGYKSFPRLIYSWIMEGIRDIFVNWRDIPHNMINFEMYDYVEWKTGYRSEGIVASVDGLVNKLVKNNLNSLIGNAVVQWTGYLGYDIPRERQPERFIKSIWPLTHLSPFVGELVTFFFLLWFKYPHDPKEVEADLIERRALAQKFNSQLTMHNEQ